MAHNTPLPLHSPTRPVLKGDHYRVGQYRSVWVIAILFSLLPSCKPDNIQNDVKPKYFDLAGYFKADTAKLRRLNHLTLKTVTHNGASETKKIHIDDWGLELSLFIQSDINKPAWRDSYNIQPRNNGSVVYMAKTPELRTREIAIARNEDKSIKWIIIHNASKNILYQTTEVLTYYPDSLYIINKTQHVRFLGTNKYSIKGTLINDARR
ncbi:hypothetical protein [Mucilaginibacter panaciglaebae]|uniref:LPS export ABC transporter protein LptC n=1 Tax=Mucilaginibacter panaciglaebae TaxID=502331 RepID=A0ABP7X474_9SPHI